MQSVPIKLIHFGSRELTKVDFPTWTRNVATATFYAKYRAVPDKPKAEPKGYCPKCGSENHFLNACFEIKNMTFDDMMESLKGHCKK